MDTARNFFTILEAATLHGTLADASRANRRRTTQAPPSPHRRNDRKRYGRFTVVPKVKVPITPAVRGEPTTIHNLLANPLFKWEMQIGHGIPRNPQFTSFGDACLTAGGAFCDTVEFWFDIH